jgi:HSP20 family molecular chaperone IbpA
MQLPCAVDKDNTQALLKNGVLTVTLKKEEN